jgi:SNF2 family DNA or RNA helicase
MITKIGIQLQEHQKRIENKMVDPSRKGLLAWHSLGSGKTLTALNAAQALINQQQQAQGKNGKIDPEELKKKILAIVPAPLVNNIYKEIDKHKLNIPKDRLDVMSYDSAVNKIQDLLKNKYKMTILDEGHKLRNTGTKRYQKLKQLLQDRSDKNLILTGTASYNNLDDIVPLIHLIAGSNDNFAKQFIPKDPKEFKQLYVGEKVIKPGVLSRLFQGAPKEIKIPQLKNVDTLTNALSKYVDYHNSLDVNPKDFPELREKVIPVEMSKEQKRMYNYLMGEMPWIMRKKIEWGLPLNKSESQHLNAFSTGVRQVSDSTTPYKKDHEITSSPKIDLAVKNLVEKLKANPMHRAMVYSNYLDAGLLPYSKKLKELGVPHYVFTGQLNDKQRKEIVNNFNSTHDNDAVDKAKVLLLSSSGGEGLDLKGVRQVQILEPHFNKSKIDQVIGRASRYKSHEHLPEEDRNVDVEYYHSLIPKNILNKLKLKKPVKSIDEYLHENSLDKDSLVKQLISGIKQKQQQQQQYQLQQHK